MTIQEFKKINTLSGLLKVALDDLEKVQNNKHYVIRMTEWHLPFEAYDYCRVCLAGAVMANTLKVKRHLEKSPNDFIMDDPIYKRLMTVNKIRSLWLADAYVYFHLYSLRKEEWAKEILELLDYELDECDSEITMFTNYEASMKFYRKLQFTLEWLGF